MKLFSRAFNSYKSTFLKLIGVIKNMSLQSEVALYREDKPKQTQERLDHHYFYWEHYSSDEKPERDEFYSQLGNSMLAENDFQLFQIIRTADRKHVGDITIQRPRFTENINLREIDISVFQQHQSKNIGKKALENFIKAWIENEVTERFMLQAKVLNHRDRKKIIYLLEGNGFSKVEGESDEAIVVMRFEPKRIE